MSTLTQTNTFDKTPRSQSKLRSIFRQYIANVSVGQRLYSSLLDFEKIDSVQQVEGLVYQYGTNDESSRFFDLVQEQENSMTPVSDAIFAFSRRYDNEWYTRNVVAKL